MLKTFVLEPGIVKVNTDRMSEGRFIDSNWIRWAKGLPQKMGGFEAMLEEAVVGKARGMLPWRDNDQNRRIAIGTHRKAYIVSADQLIDVTPYDILRSGTLSDAISTVSGDNTVTVKHAGHGLKVGDQVPLVVEEIVGGLLIRGTYSVGTVPDANTWTFEHPLAATDTVSDDGGAVEYLYARSSLSDPFDTSAGSDIVTVNHVAHGRSVGDYVHFADAAAVGGITIDGQYVVLSVPTSDTYTIKHSSAASSTANGGGTVSILYELPNGLDNAAEAYGYGVGAYGVGTYGTARTTGAITLHSRTWTFDAYGTWLIACPRGGRIYRWDPAVGGRMAPLAGSPEFNEAVFVTEQRNIVSVGADGFKRKLRWADDEDPTDWVATAENTADERMVQSLGDLITGMRLKNGVSLIWSEGAVYALRYTGDDFVYDLRKLADTGLLGPGAITEFDGVAYWASDSDFHASSGGVPVALPSSDIRQWFFERLNINQRDKVIVGTIRKYNEIICFYPAGDDLENACYVKFNVKEQLWDVGELPRTAWLDNPIFLNPIAAGTDGTLYHHESGHDADGSPIRSYITAAPWDLGEGDEHVDILGIIPDFHELAGTMQIHLLTKYYPNEDETESEAYQATRTTRVIDTRETGRQVGFRLTNEDLGGRWRLGALRLDIRPTGSRR